MHASVSRVSYLQGWQGCLKGSDELSVIRVFDMCKRDAESLTVESDTNLNSGRKAFAAVESDANHCAVMRRGYRNDIAGE